MTTRFITSKTLLLVQLQNVPVEIRLCHAAMLSDLERWGFLGACAKRVRDTKTNNEFP